MANLTTTLRLVLLFILVGMVYEAEPRWQLLNMPLVAVIFILDGVDGWVARRRGEATAFGAVYDIAVDRVIENVLWIVLSDLDFVPVWVPILFITRSFLVDVIRSKEAKRGRSPFDMLRSPVGRFLVASRTVRLTYGVSKAVAFGWILLIQPLARFEAHAWARSGECVLLTSILVYTAAALCLLRGLPVLIEFAATSWREFTPHKRPATGRTRSSSPLGRHAPISGHHLPH